MKDIRQIGRHFISDGEFKRMLLDILEWVGVYIESQEKVTPVVLQSTTADPNRIEALVIGGSTIDQR